MRCIIIVCLLFLYGCVPYIQQYEGDAIERAMHVTLNLRDRGYEAHPIIKVRKNNKATLMVKYKKNNDDKWFYYHNYNTENPEEYFGALRDTYSSNIK